MDSKISAFPVSTAVLPLDIIPVVTGGFNKRVTVDFLASNLPNLGNNGISKNAVVSASAAIIPLVNTVVTLPTLVAPYTLPNGSGGQEIVLVSLGVNVVVPTSSLVTSISMVNGSSISLVFIGSISKWVPKSYHNCTLT